MSTNTPNPPWTVFNTIKTFPTTPETLMAEINSAISSLEYAQSTSLLKCPYPLNNKTSVPKLKSQYDARMADEAYKAGLTALASGKLDLAIQSLNTSLSKCPPHKTSAVAKLQSLISLTSHQLQLDSASNK